jgi:midasin
LACIDFSSTKLVDSAGIKPHFSLRSLVRALQATKTFLSLNIKPFNRAVFEGFSLSFIYLLNEPSQKFLTNFIAQNLTPSGAPKFETDFLNLSKPPSKPKALKDVEYILIKPFL